MLLAPGIFPKFWSIPSLISPSAPTITGSVSVLIPPILVVLISRSLYFENFSMNFVEVFWLDGTDMSICLQHHLAWSLYYYPQTFWPGLLILAQILLFLVWNLKVIDTSHSYSWANFRFLSTPPPPSYHEVHSPNTRKYFIVHSGYQTAWVHDFLSGKNGNFRYFHLIFSQLQLRI